MSRSISAHIEVRFAEYGDWHHWTIPRLQLTQLLEGLPKDRGMPKDATRATQMAFGAEEQDLTIEPSWCTGAELEKWYEQHRDFFWGSSFMVDRRPIGYVDGDPYVREEDDERTFFEARMIYWVR
jgi:hypothetical protein